MYVFCASRVAVAGCSSFTLFLSLSSSLSGCLSSHSLSLVRLRVWWFFLVFRIWCVSIFRLDFTFLSTCNSTWCLHLYDVLVKWSMLTGSYVCFWPHHFCLTFRIIQWSALWCTVVTLCRFCWLLLFVSLIEKRTATTAFSAVQSHTNEPMEPKWEEKKLCDKREKKTISNVILTSRQRVA